MRKKYSFKSYDENYPALFHAEKMRISQALPECEDVQHVGSTAVPGLGGKGIIDIAIAVARSSLPEAAKKLEELGYLFREGASTEERWFFRPDIDDADLRRYHIHLTFLESEEWKKLLAFRDFLRTHPDERERYAKLKNQASAVTDDYGEEYRKLKAVYFQTLDP